MVGDTLGLLDGSAVGSGVGGGVLCLRGEGDVLGFGSG